MTEKFFIFDGEKNREAVEVECLYCGIKFLKAKRFIKNGGKHYCCTEHFYLSQKKTIKVNCSFCDKEKEIKLSRYNKSKTKKFFCDRNCQSKAQRSDNNIDYLCNFKNGESSYREIAFRTYPHKCENCGYDEIKEILQVHHIDSDRGNNKKENLMILCPNCHFMITIKLVILENRKFIWAGSNGVTGFPCKEVD